MKSRISPSMNHRCQDQDGVCGRAPVLMKRFLAQMTRDARLLGPRPETVTAPASTGKMSRLHSRFCARLSRNGKESGKGMAIGLCGMRRPLSPGIAGEQVFQSVVPWRNLYRSRNVEVLVD